MNTYTQKQVRLAVIAVALQIVGGIVVIRAAAAALVNLVAVLP
jgi:hypothetical protein